MIRRAGASVWTIVFAYGVGVSLASGATSEEAHAYDVPRECPARMEWLAALRARLPPLLRTHPLVETQRVHIERVADATGSAYEGLLESSGEAEPRAPGRAVRAASCAELIDVLSFMGALALERIAGEPVRASGAARGSATPLSIEARALVGADRDAATADVDDASGFRGGAMAFAFVQTGIAPGRSLDFGAGGRLEWSALGWQPLVLFGVYFGRASEVSVGGAAKVRFEHWSTQTVGCPWRFPSRGVLGLRPCVDFDLGVTRGEGVGVPGAEAHSAAWVSAGTQLRFELALGDRLELGAVLGATKPLYRARFFIKPSSTAFETDDFGVRTGTYASLLF